MGQITVGVVTGGTSVSVAGTAGNRVVTGVGAGIATNDAVNVAQLGTVAAKSANAVQYDVAGGLRTNSVTLAGGAAGPVLVTNLAPGTLTATSTDAVNGSPLFATNGQVSTNTANIAGNTSAIATNTTNIAGNTTAITNLNAGINNGTSGLVQQVGGTPGAGQITVGAAKGGASLSVAGTGGNRVVTGVAAGVAASDAVNVSQLGAVSAQSANAVQYDLDGLGGRTNTVTLAGGAAGPVLITNVASATLSATSAEAVNGAKLFATNTQVAANTTNIAGNTTAITNLTTGLNNGTVGLVQQTGGSPGNGAITVGAATGGTSINVAGTSGNRFISGVAAGVAGNDAATVAKLASVTGGALNAVQYDTVAGGRTNSVTLVGGAAGNVTVTNVAAGQLVAGSTDAVNGSQLAATNANVASNTIIITNYTAQINSLLTGQAGTFQSNNTALAAAPAASGANASAGGFGAVASGVQTVALGNNASATGTISVAVGYGSSDGSASNVASFGSVGAERRLTNVGPAINGTDAVNLSQLQAGSAQYQAGFGNLQGQINNIAYNLYDFRRKANSGTAGAMAVAGLPQVFLAGAGMVGPAFGEFEGQVAFAFGLSKIVGDQTVVKAAGTITGRGQAGFNAGIGYQF